MPQVTDIYGKGISYPFKFERGIVKQTSGVEKVNESLMLLFDTAEDEIFMGEVGSKFRNLAFITDKAVFESLAEAYIIDTINKYEPRIESITNIVFNWIDDNTVNIEIIYTLIGSPVEHNFVYPYKTV